MVSISVIIISYNTKKITLECLDSIKKYTKNVDYEVIVVDNASTDDSWESIKGVKNVKSIKSETNLGFAGGNNLGIKKSNGRYILLLNSDTFFKENSLLKMLKFMDKNPKVGIAGCKLLNLDGSIQSNGGFFPNLGRVLLWSTFLDDLPIVSKVFGSYHPSDNNLFNLVHEQDWITGAFFMIRKDLIQEIGLLNENFFMYVEELEYCFRAKKADFKVMYTPETKIIHLGAGSKDSWFAILQEFKNLPLFYRLHYTFIETFILKILLKLNALLRILVLGLLFQRKGALKTYAKTFISF